MKSSLKIAIIPAAGKPTNKILTHTNLPDTMLPINGKPVIGYILEDLLNRSIFQVILVLNKDDVQTENYVNKKFGSKLSITTTYSDNYERGVGYSIHCAANYITDDTDSVLIYLGDTIYKGPLLLTEDFLVTTNNFDSSEKWCFIENFENGYRYLDKPKDYKGNGQVLTGIYHFKDAGIFKAAVSKSEKTYAELQISHILESYEKPFTLIPAEQYYDCGNIENYYRAKIDFLKTRSFNTIFYNDLYGTITKTGLKKTKLEDEINWYKNIPEELKVFSPRLIDYKISRKQTEYSLEYYGYQSLADYFLFNHFDNKVWYLIIDRLFEILELFKKYTTILPYSYYDEMYRLKTQERVNNLRKEPYWDSLFSQENILVNGESFLGWPSFENKLESIVKRLYSDSEMTFIHGDLCLSNILFDPNSRIFKFIDPRGSFGPTSVYGDLKYDIAKLQHSFSGKYDFIVSDLFSLSEENNGFTFKTFHEDEHEEINNYFELKLQKSGYDLNTIRTIEALLFLSMIPLHKDSESRQKAMFVTGIKLLNQITI